MKDKQIKKETSEKKPWSHKFGEEDNTKNKQFSRVARNQKKSVAPLSNVLMIIMLIVVVVPIIFMIWFYHHTKQPTIEPMTAESIMYSKSLEESASMAIIESEQEESERQALESSLSASNTTSEETQNPVESQKPAESSVEQKPVETEKPAESQKPMESSTEQKPSGDGAYQIYTVKSGDNLYRIALNHGLTLDGLKELNGLTSNDVYIGMELKVPQ